MWDSSGVFANIRSLGAPVMLFELNSVVQFVSLVTDFDKNMKTFS